MSLMVCSAGTSKRFDNKFDLAASRTSEVIDSGTPVTFTYNTAKQITNTDFTYDGDGRKVAQTVSNIVTDQDY